MRVRVRRHYHTFAGDKLVRCWRCYTNLLESEAIREGERFFHPWCFDETEPGERQGRSTGIEKPGGGGTGACNLTHYRVFGKRDNFFRNYRNIAFFTRQ